MVDTFDKVWLKRSTTVTDPNTLIARSHKPDKLFLGDNGETGPTGLRVTPSYQVYAKVLKLHKLRDMGRYSPTSFWHGVYWVELLEICYI